jgi:hypothetical protein
MARRERSALAAISVPSAVPMAMPSEVCNLILTPRRQRPPVGAPWFPGACHKWQPLAGGMDGPVERRRPGRWSGEDAIARPTRRQLGARTLREGK